MNTLMDHPLIGVTPGLNDAETFLMLYRGCVDALLDAGAMPVVLPLTSDTEALSHALDRIDGLLLSGGGDLDPELFGQHQLPGCGSISPLRDAMELPLARMAIAQRKPMLGICRGLQVMNVALGGSIWQDLSMRPEVTLQHRQKQSDTYVSHPVQFKQGSRLQKAIGEDRIMVNSLHHQGIDRLGAGLEATALSPDGLVEACELPASSFCVGVQWHPERLWQKDMAAKKLFLAFIQACRGE